MDYSNQDNIRSPDQVVREQLLPNRTNINEEYDKDLMRAIENSYESDLAIAIRQSLNYSTPSDTEKAINNSLKEMSSDLDNVLDNSLKERSSDTVLDNSEISSTIDSDLDNAIKESLELYKKINQEKRGNELRMIYMTLNNLSRLDPHMSSSLKMLHSIINDFIECNIDNIQITQNDYDNIFNELRKIKVNKDELKLLKEFILTL